MSNEMSNMRRVSWWEAFKAYRKDPNEGTISRFLTIVLAGIAPFGVPPGIVDDATIVGILNDPLVAVLVLAFISLMRKVSKRRDQPIPESERLKQIEQLARQSVIQQLRSEQQRPHGQHPQDWPQPPPSYPDDRYPYPR